MPAKYGFNSTSDSEGGPSYLSVALKLICEAPNAKHLPPARRAVQAGMTKAEDLR